MWSWTLAILGVMIVYLAIWPELIRELMPESSRQAQKYAFAFSIIPLAIQAGAVSLVVCGMWSIIRRSAAPVLGVLLAAALFMPVMLVSAIFGLILVIITSPLCKVWPQLNAIPPSVCAFVVPVGLIALAIGRKPKEKETFQPDARQVSSEAAPSASPDEPSA